MGRFRATLSLAVLLAFLGWAYWPFRKPSVLLVTVDSLRPDRLGAYGSRTTRTPNFDWLARHGVVFLDAVCDVPWTTASVASTMTGRYASGHGLRTPYDRLAESETTLAELLRAAGYRTAAFVGSFFVDSVFGLAQGFEVYDDRYDIPVVVREVERPPMESRFFGSPRRDRAFQVRKLEAKSARTDAAVADAAIGWIRKVDRRTPFFLWVHFFGPHGQRRRGEDTARAVSRRLSEYDGLVENVDAQLGRILSALQEEKLLRHTLVVVHADHGESLLEHGVLGHGTTLYEPELRIPLVFATPGGDIEARRLSSLARNVDILPTVLELLGLPIPAGIDGRSLEPEMAGQGREGRDVVAYAETLLPATVLRAPRIPTGQGRSVPLGLARFAVRTGRWKYVRTEPRPLLDGPAPSGVPGEEAETLRAIELFDLSRDPGELQNVAGRKKDVQARMERLLRTFCPSLEPAEEGAS
ncbi:MAG: hypothetical protein KatS3mg076_0315 [Candidatus Binatia bacterium]|nr:MAG: hypothetical protein KatS3mg076_0315 [Candidatus Binatia bacterium]